MDTEKKKARGKVEKAVIRQLPEGGWEAEGVGTFPSAIEARDAVTAWADEFLTEDPGAWAATMIEWHPIDRIGRIVVEAIQED